MRALLLAVLAAPLAASAQLAPADVPVGSVNAAHAVPFGSAGNAVELEVTGDLDPYGRGLTVAVVRVPGWLSFPAASADVVEEGGVPVARLSFDVLRSAPVDDPDEVVFEVRAGGAVVATHTVLLRVEAPAELALDTPYPNPSRGGVTVPFEIPSAGHVRVSAFDVLGREVVVLVDGEREPGAHEARLDVSGLAAGAYVVRLVGEADGRVGVRAQRLTVVR